MKFISLENKIAVVVGPFNEVTKAIECAFAAVGSKVVFAGKVTDDADACCEELRAEGFDVQNYDIDYKNSKEIQKVFQKISVEKGNIDILINTWRQPSYEAAEDISDEAWNEVMADVLNSTFYSCRSVIPFMLKNGKGTIINVSSIAGMRGIVEDGLHYCAASAGLMTFAKQLTLQYSHRGIRINTVEAGYLECDTDPIVKQATKCPPLYKLGKAEDIASAVLFAASDAGGYLAGETVHVNGGVYMI